MERERKHDEVQTKRHLRGGPGKILSKRHATLHYSGNKPGQRKAEAERRPDEAAAEADERRDHRLPAASEKP